MPKRHLPVSPDLLQLRHQAKDLLHQIRSGDPAAGEDLKRYHFKEVASEKAKLADAQFVLARSYEAPNWPRLALACQLVEAIWADDVERVRKRLPR